MTREKRELRSSNKEKIIGGMFGLEIGKRENRHPPKFLHGNNLFLANARSGIWLLVNQLRPKSVWFPSYLCEVMIRAVDTSISKIKLYETSYDLKIPSSEWIDDVEEGDLVVFIAYFGFPIDNRLTRKAKERKAWVLEDDSQALLSNKHDPNADFLIFSPRKFIGVPDGGILIIISEHDFHIQKLFPPPQDWWLNSLRASILRREFDQFGGSNEWFDLFQNVDRNGPIGMYSMSELTRIILFNSINYESISKRRIENFHFLATRLKEYALFSSLEPGVVPLGFPIRLNSRDSIRQRLFDEKIFTPVHWPIRGLVPDEFDESHRLSEAILTIPCDQRYDNQDMKRISDLVLKR